MERLDGARRIQRWTLSIKSVLSSIYGVMFMRSRKVPSWENMDSDILAKIFEKLNVVDITVGASRVCVTWFLAAHQKSLSKTINLANPKLVEFKHPRVKNLRLKSQYVNVEEEGLHNMRKILIRVTKFSGTVPTNLFFNFYSFVEDEDPIIASERMPNIRKLVLPQWCNLRESSYKFAFSQWKNLHTLIISTHFYSKGIVEFRFIGENCTNLTNLKLSGHVDPYIAEGIVCYLPKLKRVSMRCCVIDSTQEVSLLITYLQNLTILNLSHCMFKTSLKDSLFEESFIKTATPKIDTLIMCSEVGCRLCEDRSRILGSNAYYEKHWRNDEIKELGF
ncbi:PREDICTED: putative F-box protein At4g11580 [Camelina sativa]|uniref:F-box protein At4g11580 n=1 Tax=Camelina sativa TaxID=90675 RepID=A0ABM1QN65_CAMSA|nr:PREDICTED: putative F-box protein At4g11580 [Camelina sativa]